MIEALAYDYVTHGVVHLIKSLHNDWHNIETTEVTTRHLSDMNLTLLRSVHIHWDTTAAETHVDNE